MKRKFFYEEFLLTQTQTPIILTPRLSWVSRLTFATKLYAGCLARLHCIERDSWGGEPNPSSLASLAPSGSDVFCSPPPLRVRRVEYVSPLLKSSGPAVAGIAAHNLSRKAGLSPEA